MNLPASISTFIPPSPLSIIVLNSPPLLLISSLLPASPQGGPTVGTVDLWQDHGPAWGQNGTFSTWLYARRAVSIINAHPTNGTPLFMYIPWHVVHTPLQAPASYFYPNMFNNSDPNRHTMNGMLSILDEGVANVTAALKQRGLWANTLLVFSSDNVGAAQLL